MIDNITTLPNFQDNNINTTVYVISNEVSNLNEGIYVFKLSDNKHIDDNYILRFKFNNTTSSGINQNEFFNCIYEIINNFNKLKLLNNPPIGTFILKKYHKNYSENKWVIICRLICKQYLKLNIPLLQLLTHTKKSDHWIWWLFPTEQPGNIEPDPKTYVFTETAYFLLYNYPNVWRMCLERMVLLNIFEFFPQFDYGRIYYFTIFWNKFIMTLSQKDKIKFNWFIQIMDKLNHKSFMVEIIQYQINTSQLSKEVYIKNLTDLINGGIKFSSEFYRYR